MNVFADTSGFFALMARNDYMHVRAKENFNYFAKERARLLTSSFVLVETIALLQRRIGLEPVHEFNAKILPLLEVVWIDKQWYWKGIQRVFSHGNRSLSLVDCISFEIMESREISIAFTFDKHFSDCGFTIADFNEKESDISKN
jgi:predicted nucleic acid-binding protein